MTYKEFLPNERLKDTIACYWTINFNREKKSEFKDVVLPDGCYDFIINLGAEYSRLDLDVKSKTKVSEYALIGQRKKAVSIQQSSDTHIFAIRFKPSKINALLTIKPAEIINEIVTSPELEYNFAHPIKKILSNHTVTSDKVKLIDELLMRKLNCQYSKFSFVDSAISDIIISNGNLKITDYCRHKHIHKSTLEKAFINYVGISPKEFSSIIRFNYSCALMNSWGLKNLAGVAIEAGYYDQAHMCKVFKQFTDTSPKDFFAQGFILPQTGIEFQNSMSKYF